MKIYVAGKWADKENIRDVHKTLVQFGHSITHDWTTQAGMKDSVCAVNDIEGVANCDVLLVIFSDPHYAYRGTFTEIGCALGLRKEIICVCPPIGEFYCKTNCFFHHPNIRHVKSLEDAVELIEDFKKDAHRIVAVA